MSKAHGITFQSSKFDVASETPNPINPIYGQSLLLWLRGKIGAPYNVSEPAPEDWGWYVDVTGSGTTYLVGASADPDEGNASLEWHLQIHKHRSFKDNLTGANKLTSDDALTARIASILRAAPEIRAVEIEIP